MAIQPIPEAGHGIRSAVSSDAFPELEWPEPLSFSLQMTPFLRKDLKTIYCQVPDGLEQTGNSNT